jgi:uncharacterized membrane protein
MDQKRTVGTLPETLRPPTVKAIFQLSNRLGMQTTRHPPPRSERRGSAHRRTRSAQIGRLTRWSAVLGVLGLAISIYLTVAHYAQGQFPLACATGGAVNCEQVTSSAESMIGPLPVAALGVVWFAVLLGLLATGRANPLQLAWTAVGVAFVFYLVYAELFVIGTICLWCTAAHGLVLGLFLLAVAATTADAQELAAG